MEGRKANIGFIQDFIWPSFKPREYTIAKNNKANVLEHSLSDFCSEFVKPLKLKLDLDASVHLQPWSNHVCLERKGKDIAGKKNNPACDNMVIWETLCRLLNLIRTQCKKSQVAPKQTGVK